MANMIDNIKERVGETLERDSYTNISKTERLLSVATGSFFAVKGIRRLFSKPWLAVSELALSYSLINRGLKGYCPIAEKFAKEEHRSEPIIVIKGTTISS